MAVYLTDGQQVARISMRLWDIETYQYGSDVANDFFGVGCLPRYGDADRGALVYRVDDVQYCVDAAQEWTRMETDGTSVPTLDVDMEPLILSDDVDEAALIRAYSYALDMLVEDRGAAHVIDLLQDVGVTAGQLVALGFDPGDVARVVYGMDD